MDNFAKLSASDRREIIQEVATRMGVDFTIIDKDFWVCWTLESLFALPAGNAPMIFKGGTSLSKAYALIQRFSEDIDVVTDSAFFLAKGLLDPAEDGISGSQREKRMHALDEACAAYVAGTLFNDLERRFVERLGTENGWRLTMDSEDTYQHTLLFQYPQSDPDIAYSYIRGSVKMELGWRSVALPAETRLITPYLADQIPQLMTAEIPCNVLLPARTFWEKVTALHAASFRDRVQPFFSRHYSDVASMLQTQIGKAAAQDVAMLEAVRRYKDVLYHSARARYDLAGPGSLVIVPDTRKLRELALDYRNMKPMFFREPPSFDQVIDHLRQFETEINAQ